MKKLFILILLSAFVQFSWAQTCPPSCDKTSCGPEGTKTKEAAVITTMRTEVQTLLTKMTKSNIAFDKQIADMKLEKGENDDESLLFLSQAVTAIRYELTSRLDGSKQLPALKQFKPASSSSKQQMVASLKKEIQLLASQADRL